MKLAFATIATNKYAAYAKNLIETIDRYAFTGSNVEVCVVIYTNNEKNFLNYTPTNIKIKTVNITHVPFPLISLLRYHYYTSDDSLKNYDYVYHIDCDMLLQDNVGEEIVGDRVCVEHPGFFQQFNNLNFPYDRNPVANAYVKMGLGTKYYQNCLQGGSVNEFFNMSVELRNRIEEDLRKNYIALWHDESYMNKYMVDNPPTLILPTTYAQPQGWPSYGPTKILHVDKNHLEVRKTK